MVDNGSMQVSLSNSSGQYPENPLATILERAITEYHPAPTHSPADSEAFRASVLKMLSWAATLPAIGDRIPLSLTILSTGMRSVVLRVRYGSNPHTPWQPESVILKRYRREIQRLTQAVLDTFGKNTVRLPSMRWFQISTLPSTVLMMTYAA